MVLAALGAGARNRRRLWIRRACFQIHLWAGIILAAYVTVIGVTGSILVFGAELGRLENPSPWPQLSPGRSPASLQTVITSLRTTYPDTHIVSIMAPTGAEPIFRATLQSTRRFMAACDPMSGKVQAEIPRRTSRLEWIYDLHENLLARRTGRVVNGFSAMALLLLVLTGIVNWWPGINNWKKAITIDFRRRWKRVNFDIHRAVGFWSIGFLTLWAASGVYFAWPEKVVAVVNHLSPIINSLPPAITVDPESQMEKIDFNAMLAKANAANPETHWKGLVFPSSRRSPFEVLLSRSAGVGRDDETTVYINPYNGQYITTWRYGVNRSIGDWFVWIQMPLHFGTHWGLLVKCVWALMGLALPLLSITGLTMYWNRVLSKKWKYA